MIYTKYSIIVSRILIKYAIMPAAPKTASHIGILSCILQSLRYVTPM